MTETPEPPLPITPDMLLSRRVDFERRMRRAPPVTLATIAVLVVVFMAEVAAGALASRRGIVAAGALVREGVAAGEYWRLLSATFLHGSVDHLVGNAIALYILGMVCEHAFGHGQFVILYVTSALAGSLVSLLTSPGPSVGASGAIFGLQGAAIVLFRAHRDRLLLRASAAPRGRERDPAALSTVSRPGLGGAAVGAEPGLPDPGGSARDGAGRGDPVAHQPVEPELPPHRPHERPGRGEQAALFPLGDLVGGADAVDELAQRAGGAGAELRECHVPEVARAGAARQLVDDVAVGRAVSGPLRQRPRELAPETRQLVVVEVRAEDRKRAERVPIGGIEAEQMQRLAPLHRQEVARGVVEV